MDGVWDNSIFNDNFSYETNTTSNSTDDDNQMSQATMIVTSLALGILIVATIVGNVFVIAAICLERHLHSVANYLILSLAVADLLVACLVMPLGAIYEVSRQWAFGAELCDMWTASDVLCCTASILHLVAIALDRFWAVTNVNYIHQRNTTLVGGMIVAVWLLSALVSLAPIFGWKDMHWETRVKEQICLVSQDVGYQVFATLSSFYLPLCIIIFLYWQIYKTARKRIRNRVGSGSLQQRSRRSQAPNQETSVFTNNANGAQASREQPQRQNSQHAGSAPAEGIARNGSVLSEKRPSRTRKESTKEKKAAKTLMIITGAFVMCWLPFFVMALLMPLCSSCYFSDLMIAVFLWLGYFNSTLNPIIYTIFSPEFRYAFKKMIFGRKYLQRQYTLSRGTTIRRREPTCNEMSQF